MKLYEPELKILGKHKTSVGCLDITKLDDIDLQVLKKFIDEQIDSWRFYRPL